MKKRAILVWSEYGLVAFEILAGGVLPAVLFCGRSYVGDYCTVERGNIPMRTEEVVVGIVLEEFYL